MLEGASIHHGIEKCSVARRLDDIHARAIARPVRKRGNDSLFKATGNDNALLNIRVLEREKGWKCLTV